MAGATEQYLIRGTDPLAVLRPVGKWRYADYPWVAAAWEPLPAFEPLRPLFEREAEFLDVDQEPENTVWLEIWEELKAPGLYVGSATGRSRTPGRWIHFREDRAWWWPLDAPANQPAMPPAE